MSSNSKPENPAHQASRKRPLTRSEEENAEKKELEMTKAYINLDQKKISTSSRRSGSKRPDRQRPRARYLYFLYVSAILKKAWDHKNRRKPEAVLKDQIGKRMWATKGRYLHRAMLVAMSQEAGHHLDEDWDRPPHPGSDEEELQLDAEGAIGLIAIAKYIAISQDTPAEEEDSSDGECETQQSEVEDEN
ncbi:hypothetical protein B0T13DRAFT_506951 [Neurospora crassa]|nr:hypothetical protein B0T13DRAFT_506951 [Neurospora crassa]